MRIIPFPLVFISRFTLIVDWELRKLGNLFNTYSGMTPLRSDLSNFENPTIPWIKTTDLNNTMIENNEEKISDKAASKLRLLPKNTVLIAMYGGFNQIGRTGLLSYSATINQALIALEPVKDINQYFLLTELNYRVNDWKRLAASSRKDPNITKKDIEDFVLYYPSIDEQNKISGFFEILDSAIALHQRKYDALLRLKEAYLQNMFAKNGESVPKLRFANFEGDWEQCKLGEISEILRGASPRPIQDPKWFDIESDIGWLRISDVTKQNGRIYYLEQRLSKAGQEKTRVLTEPHLLLSIAATVGKPVINYIKTGVHDGFLIFQKPKFDKEFMFQWLEMYRKKWRKYGQPGSQVNLNSDLVKHQNIRIPNKEEQEKVGILFHKFEHAILLQQKKLEQLQRVKKAFLQKMLL